MEKVPFLSLQVWKLQFLQEEQDEVIEASEAAERMRNFLQDPARDVEEPYFTLSGIGSAL